MRIYKIMEQHRQNLALLPHIYFHPNEKLFSCLEKGIEFLN